MTTTDNEFVKRARVTKAIKLENQIRLTHPSITGDELRAMEPRMRARLSLAAGLRKHPSDETWRVVVSLIETNSLPKEYQ